MRAFFRKQNQSWDDAVGRAAFDNYASVLLLDSSGRERVLFQSEQLTPESLAHDIRRLQSQP